MDVRRHEAGMVYCWLELSPRVVAIECLGFSPYLGLWIYLRHVGEERRARKKTDRDESKGKWNDKK